MATNKHPFKSPGNLDGQQSTELARQIDRYDDRPNVAKLEATGIKPALAAEFVAQITTGIADQQKLVAAGASGTLAEIFALALNGGGM